MATVINNPGNRDDGDGGAGWTVAVIILIVVIGVGVYLWMQNQGANTAQPADTSQPQSTGDNTINVILPGTNATSSATSSSSL